MTDEIIEISEIQAKRLYLEAKRLETENGVSMEEVLLRIAFESEDHRARVDAMRVYFAIIYNSRLDLDSMLTKPNLAEVMSLNSE
jgi:hypothetical protein